MKKITKKAIKKCENIDAELYLLFQDVYRDEKSRIQAVKEAMRVRHYFKNQEFLQFDLDSDFNDENNLFN